MFYLTVCIFPCQHIAYPAPLVSVNITAETVFIILSLFRISKGYFNRGILTHTLTADVIMIRETINYVKTKETIQSFNERED